MTSFVTTSSSTSQLDPSTYDVLASLFKTPAKWKPLQEKQLESESAGLGAFVQEQIARIKQKQPDLSTFDEYAIAQGLRSLTPTLQPSAAGAKQPKEGKPGWTTKTESSTP
jgi:hypothetical protein